MFFDRIVLMSSLLLFVHVIQKKGIPIADMRKYCTTLQYDAFFSYSSPLLSFLFSSISGGFLMLPPNLLCQIYCSSTI
ncbi:hypothetical protein VIGAN_03274000 [Vigna angularis var. angularis]|uniref:Uncharacterized protein n=1 Tax=Vigna angularis var. angularis TaxID=157739 RepID=A0A0S3RQ73_PHAAN|nr:hypothetical protein VIGAN_03274000 [Vigna angularis var. angularis]